MPNEIPRNTSELALKLQAHMTENGITQSAVAKAVGRSTSVVSGYLSGKYPGDVAAFEEKIRQYLELEEERAESAVLPIVPVVKTTAWASVTNAIKVAAHKRAIISVTGPAGVGKTTAVEEYLRNNTATILITAHQGYTSRDLFCELCDSLSVSPKGTLHAQLKRIVEKLEGSGRLIIIDQAEYLPRIALDMLRSVRDFAKIPIALVGLPRLNEIIVGDQNNFAQLSSRMRLRRKVDPMTANDEEILIHAYMGDVPQDVIAALHKHCRRNARILVDLIDWCLDLSRLNKTAVTADAVAYAAEVSGAIA